MIEEKIEKYPYHNLMMTEMIKLLRKKQQENSIKTSKSRT